MIILQISINIKIIKTRGEIFHKRAKGIKIKMEGRRELKEVETMDKELKIYLKNNLKASDRANAVKQNNYSFESQKYKGKERELMQCQESNGPRVEIRYNERNEPFIKNINQKTSHEKRSKREIGKSQSSIILSFKSF